MVASYLRTAEISLFVCVRQACFYFTEEFGLTQAVFPRPTLDLIFKEHKLEAIELPAIISFAKRKPAPGLRNQIVAHILAIK